VLRKGQNNQATANRFVENKGGIAMLDTIGESAVRTTTRTDNNLAVENKESPLKRSKRPLKNDPSRVLKKVQNPNPIQKKEPVATMWMIEASTLKNMIKTGT
jgi:hypothetical protein